MLFTSMEFIIVFFPLVFIINYLLPGRTKNYWLLLASLFFYAWGEPRFVFVMIVSILLNWLFAMRIELLKEREGQRKAVLILAIAVNLGILFVFKYLNFFTGILRGLSPALRSAVPQTSVLLPIGISFFTFQELSYVIDVYRGTKAQKNPAYLGLYVSMFPQLIAGPIVRYTTVERQITDRRVTFDAVSEGLFRFLTGFNKKVLLANVLAEAADYAFGGGTGSVCMAWLGALCYTLQIFFDFSGYSDMAIGMGRMLGFDFPENFDYPYISGSITEFWRRWHMSLGSWFRDYVYFPMGGSRVSSRGRLIFNLMTVWLLTGIWHGANWTYVIWGLIYGVLIVAEKKLKIPERFKAATKPVRVFHVGVAAIITVLMFVIFRSDTIGNAVEYLKTMFGMNGTVWVDDAFFFHAREYAVYLAFGMLCSTPVFAVLRKHAFRHEETGENIHRAVQIVLFVFSISFLMMNAHNPFIYFNF